MSTSNASVNIRLLHAFSTGAINITIMSLSLINTYIIIIVFKSLTSEVKNSPRHNVFTEKVSDLEVS